MIRPWGSIDRISEIKIHLFVRNSFVLLCPWPELPPYACLPGNTGGHNGAETDHNGEVGATRASSGEILAQSRAHRRSPHDVAAAALSGQSHETTER